METFSLAAQLALGEDGSQLSVGQMAVRAVVVYLVTLAIVRMGKKRFLGRGTAFDAILGIILGSVVSRAITGNAPFLPTLVAAAVLIGMHWLLSLIALWFHWFGTLIKGHDRVLVRDGVVDWTQMRRAHMTERDLAEDVRMKGVPELDEVAEVRLERSGEISVQKKPGQPKVVELPVREGVQTVRIELAG